MVHQVHARSHGYHLTHRSAISSQPPVGQGVGVELNVQYSTAEWFPSGLMAVESMADTALLPLELGRMGHRFSPCIPCQRRNLYMLCVSECERTRWTNLFSLHWVNMQILVHKCMLAERHV